MADSEIAFASTASLARKVADGEISSVELVQLFARRHEAHGKAINAVVQTDFDKALAAAQAADQAMADGQELEPLHGVPFTIKECFEVTGFKATAGASELAHHTPRRDADVIALMRGAGAIFMGKTNIPEWAMDLQSFNDLFGVTNNPWDVTRTCGGSSGGSAAALAAGLTGGDIGSDIGGSLRNPAHYNGVYSHKPTYGLLSQRGHVPPLPGVMTATDLNVVGPMGRSAEDLHLLFNVMRQPVGLERSRVVADVPPRARQLEEFRVAMWSGHPSNRPSKAVAARFEALKTALNGNTATLEEVWPLTDSYDSLIETYATLLTGALAGGAPPWQFRASQIAAPFLAGLSALGLGSHKGVGAMMAGTAQSHRSWLSAEERRSKMRWQIDRFFEDFDVLLMPVWPWTAPPHDPSGVVATRKITIDGRERAYTDALDYIALATTLYLPATTAPIGLAEDGLPVGVQIIGPYMQDQTTIAFADALAEVMGGFEAPPDFIE